MGFGKAWKVCKNIVTLGGDGSCDRARVKLYAEKNRYDYICSCVESCNQRIADAFDRLNAKFIITKKRLAVAEEILFPFCMSEIREVTRLRDSQTARRPHAQLNRNQTVLPSEYRGTQAALLGVGIGTSAAIGAWSTVQAVGFASTGTWIGGLHGIAASNAGWATFGGGSLATGGGGMALGHLVLPGVGIALGIGCASVMAYKEAGKMNRLCTEIKAANDENSKTLAKVQESSKILESAERKFIEEDDALLNSILLAKRMLFRYGWFSKIWRFLRYKIKGVYYTSAERPTIVALDAAVNRFMGLFGATE
ncbi:MAG: hypothetical protein P4M11_08065 [Candidatus Pacebacteria bacterium]|nr:hypothetical protein [Candidatus Paceibacterota bacterium]